MIGAQPENAPKRLLLVEDNEDAVVIYSATLVHAGYDVITAPSLEEARDAVKVKTPDLVILDLRLPDGDGLTLLEEWRRPGPMKEVPVIIVTAHGARQEMEAAAVAGADAFVHKPCPGNVLVLHVERVL